MQQQDPIDLREDDEDLKGQGGKEVGKRGAVDCGRHRGGCEVR